MSTRKSLCYLAALQECRGDINLEHSIPHAALKHSCKTLQKSRIKRGSNENGNTVFIYGSHPKWSKGVSPASACAPILCEKHNSAFGGHTDPALTLLFDGLSSVLESKTLTFRRRHVVSGIMKSAIGLMYTWALSSEEEVTPLTESAAELVVGRTSDVDERLYLVVLDDWCKAERSDVELSTHTTYLFWSDDKDSIVGIELRFWFGIGLLVWFDDSDPVGIDVDGVEAVYAITAGSRCVVNVRGCGAKDGNAVVELVFV